jgi:diacylglycerol kinase
MSFRQLIKSFRYAAHGIVRVWREEQNFRLQAAVAALVFVAMFALGLGTAEKAILTLAVVMVLVLELLNSAIERVVDMLKPRLHQYVEEIKDVTAAMVLVGSIGAALIGLMIFLPHLLSLMA